MLREPRITSDAHTDSDLCPALSLSLALGKQEHTLSWSYGGAFVVFTETVAMGLPWVARVRV